MNRSAIVGGELVIDGTPTYVRAGEIHYFRLPADRWEARLRQAVDCGLNTVSSYMPWYHHEPVEGQVDLEGTSLPERNLRRFLDLSADVGLWVVARPGPFVNSELRYGGIPEWLFRNHPETMSRRADGHYVAGRTAPAEGEPVYRAYVRRWYRAVNALLREYDRNRGGPLILYQPDNELSAAWTYGLTNSLYDPTVLAETWPNWLRERYDGDLAAVEARHERKYTSWEAIEAPREFPSTRGERALCLDWMNFKRWFFADWGATLAQWAREDGLQVPILFNEPVAGFYGHGDHAGFGRVLRERGIEGFTALHTYSPPLLDLEGATGVAQAIEITKSSPWGGPAMAVEVNTAWFIPRLDRSQINWSPLLRLGLGRGLRGWTVYPFAAGKVSLAEVIEGPDYWPTTCVDYEGRVGPGYDELSRFYRFLEAWEPELTAAHPIADLTIGYSPAQRLLDFLGWPALHPEATPAATGPGGEAFDAEPVLAAGVAGGGEGWLGGAEAVTLQTVPAEAGVWRKSREAATVCTRLNLAFDMLELTSPNREPGQGCLLIPCTGTLETAAIDYCLEHLDRGGSIVFAPCFPLLNEYGEPDSRVADRLGARLAEQVRPAGGRPLDYGARVLNLENGEEVPVNGWIFCYDLPAGAHVLASFQGRPAVFDLPGGAGKVVVAGIDPAFTNLNLLEMWRRMFTEVLGIQPAVVCEGPYCHGLLLQGPRTWFLTVLNLTGLPAVSRLRVTPPGPFGRPLELAVDLEAHEARCLVLDADLGQHRLLYATSEVLPLDAERRRLQLHGRAGTVGELVFAEPVQGRLAGTQVTSEPGETGHVLRFTHTREPLLLELR